MNPALLLLALRAVLALLLYAFLALIVVMLWKDLRAAQAEPALPPAQLVVLDGPEPGRCHVLGEVNSLGRAADNAIRIPDETVSAYHARLSYQDGQWWLEDLGSRNGTWVNDVAVDQPLVITYGDVLRLGRVRLHLGATGVGGSQDVEGPGLQS
ncbi:MAG: FHA domain-containing protein [Chloroflexota bacterium]